MKQLRAASAVNLYETESANASITRALKYIKERAAGHQRPVTVRCVADTGSHMTWEPRVVVEDMGAPADIDRSGLHAFVEALWTQLAASKATRHDQFQTMINEVR